MIELTDSEIAVTLDSLAMARDRIRDERGFDEPTPNIDSALAKLQSIVAPDTVGWRIEAFTPSDSIECDAALWHGPGHQSKAQCEVRGPHEVHVTHYDGGQRASWRTGDYTNRLRAKGIEFNSESYPENMGMTGFHDEPPAEEAGGDRA